VAAEIDNELRPLSDIVVELTSLDAKSSVLAAELSIVLGKLV
jgi:hypothetical protein